jgi:hypothetical protein
VIVFTCPECATEFDGAGRTGPFSQICASCGTEQPRGNTQCFMCGYVFGRAMDLAGPKQIRCANCHELNPKGVGQCRRCGRPVSQTGQVIHAG